MRTLLILWLLPVTFLTVWYGLSYYDLNFGFVMLSRPVHDLVFQIYGQMLGVAPEAVPPLIGKAIAVDSLIVLAIIAFRKRAAIRAWWQARSAIKNDATASQSLGDPAAAMDDSRSSAP